MVPAFSIRDFLDAMHSNYKNEKKIVMVLFARYGVEVVKNLLEESFDYLNENSGKFVDIYMPGYGKYKYQDCDLEEDEVKIELKNNKMGWSFVQPKFIEFRDVLQKASNWQYRDHMQLMIFNFEYGKISFGNYIDIDLEVAIASNHFTSTREVFEIIIQHCRRGVNDITTLSDKLFIEFGKKAFLDCVMTNIPYGIGESAKSLISLSTKRR